MLFKAEQYSQSFSLMDSAIQRTPDILSCDQMISLSAKAERQLRHNGIDNQSSSIETLWIGVSAILDCGKTTDQIDCPTLRTAVAVTSDIAPYDTRFLGLLLSSLVHEESIVCSEAHIRIRYLMRQFSNIQDKIDTLITNYDREMYCRINKIRAEIKASYQFRTQVRSATNKPIKTPATEAIAPEPDSPITIDFKFQSQSLTPVILDAKLGRDLESKLSSDSADDIYKALVKLRKLGSKGKHFLANNNLIKALCSDNLKIKQAASDAVNALSTNTQ